MGINNADEYQEWTRTTAIYPDSGSKSVSELMYLSLGLSAEAGEVANKCKKLYRDLDSDAGRDSLRSEVGDCLWYAARLCEALGTTLNIEMSRNKEKLTDRAARGKISGSGDHR